MYNFHLTNSAFTPGTPAFQGQSVQLYLLLVPSAWLMGEKRLLSVSLFNLSKTSLPVFVRNQQWWEAVGYKAHLTGCQWLENLIVALQLHRQISSVFQIVFQEVVMLLLQHNADPSIVNGSGETAKEVTHDKDIRNMLEGNFNRSKFVLGVFNMCAF